MTELKLEFSAHTQTAQFKMEGLEVLDLEKNGFFESCDRETYLAFFFLSQAHFF
jgi:hypothetical protein